MLEIRTSKPQQSADFPNLSAFMVEINAAMDRVAAVYPAGLYGRLEKHDPGLLGRIEKAVDEFDSLAVAGDLEQATAALGRWERFWLTAVALHGDPA